MNGGHSRARDLARSELPLVYRPVARGMHGYRDYVHMHKKGENFSSATKKIFFFKSPEKIFIDLFVFQT